MYFSPYGRAYEHAHTPDFIHDRKPMMGDARMSTRSSPVQQHAIPQISSTLDAWQTASGSPSPCACGDSCRCTGCSQHHHAAVPPGGAYASCANPATCLFCLDCTILSISANTVPSTLDSTSDAQSREFEDWLRQLAPSAVAASPAAMEVQSAIGPFELVPSEMSSSVHAGEGSARSIQAVAENGLRRCSCVAGSCTCPPGGCQCEQLGDGSRSRTTFAVSGERGLCCDKPEVTSSSGVPHRPPRIPEYMTMTNIRHSPMASVRQAEYYPEQAGYMSVPQVPSRSSSSSSTSSRLSRTSPISGVSAPLVWVCNLSHEPRITLASSTQAHSVAIVPNHALLILPPATFALMDNLMRPRGVLAKANMMHTQASIPRNFPELE
ncbi:hypothetical protein ID866_2690 [Astraeus odoratus]|nr:hypothetical protein ID866_2690 [Astraeus odoratus]